MFDWLRRSFSLCAAMFQISPVHCILRYSRAHTALMPSDLCWDRSHQNCQYASALSGTVSMYHDKRIQKVQMAPLVASGHHATQTKPRTIYRVHFSDSQQLTKKALRDSLPWCECSIPDIFASPTCPASPMLDKSLLSKRDWTPQPPHNAELPIHHCQGHPCCHT